MKRQYYQVQGAKPRRIVQRALDKAAKYAIVETLRQDFQRHQCRQQRQDPAAVYPGDRSHVPDESHNQDGGRSDSVQPKQLGFRVGSGILPKLPPMVQPDDQNMRADVHGGPGKADEGK